MSSSPSKGINEQRLTRGSDAAIFAFAMMLSIGAFWIPWIADILRQDDGSLYGWRAIIRFSLPMVGAALATLVLPRFYGQSRSKFSKVIVVGISLIIYFPLLLVAMSWIIGK